MKHARKDQPSRWRRRKVEVPAFSEWPVSYTYARVWPFVGVERVEPVTWRLCPHNISHFDEVSTPDIVVEAGVWHLFTRCRSAECIARYQEYLGEVEQCSTHEDGSNPSTLTSRSS